MSTARDKAIGSTIRNTAEMRPMATEIRPINSADVAPVVRVAPEDPVERVVLEDLAARVALVVPEDPVSRGCGWRWWCWKTRRRGWHWWCRKTRWSWWRWVVPEDPVAPAAEQVLAIDRVVVRAQVIVPGAEQVLAITGWRDGAGNRPGGGGAQHDQVAVVLVRDHLRARLAVRLVKTKSVTTAHRPDLVPLLAAEEDLAAAAAETTPEPVAAEAAIAWAAAE